MYLFSLEPTTFHNSQQQYEAIIEANKIFAIGRHRKCKIRFHRDNLAVSIKHFQCFYNPYIYKNYIFIYDCNSKNGVCINGERISKNEWYPVQTNATIRVANKRIFDFSFHINKLIYDHPKQNKFKYSYLVFNKFTVSTYIRRIEHEINCYIPKHLCAIILNFYFIPIIWSSKHCCLHLNNNKLIASQSNNNMKLMASQWWCSTNLRIAANISLNICKIKRWTIKILTVGINTVQILFGATPVRHKPFSNEYSFGINLCDGTCTNLRQSMLNISGTVSNNDIYTMEWDIAQSRVRYFRNNVKYKWLNLINEIRETNSYIMAVSIIGQDTEIKLMDFTEK